MKKSIFLIGCIIFLFSAGSDAQTTRLQDTISPQRISTIKTIRQQPNTMALLPDIIISIRKIEHNSGTYTISYEIKNNGTVKVDLNKISLQGSIYTSENIFVKGGCGFMLANVPILGAGTSYSGSFICTVGSSLYSNKTYKYILKADNDNILNELNENNNTAESPIVGYASPLSNMTSTIITQPVTFASKPDLTIGVLNAVETEKGLTIYYAVKNIGTVSLRVNINGIRVMGGVQDGSTTSLTSYMKLSEYNALVNPNDQINGSVTITVDNMRLRNLIAGQQYTYILKVDNIENIDEANENNNTAQHRFTAR